MVCIFIHFILNTLYSKILTYLLAIVFTENKANGEEKRWNESYLVKTTGRLFLQSLLYEE